MNSGFYKIKSYYVRQSSQSALARNESTLYQEFVISTMPPSTKNFQKATKDFEEFKEWIHVYCEDGFVNVVDAYGIMAYHEKKQ